MLGPRGQSPRVVIIGAGVVGAALADELSARGWGATITIVEQGPLPAPGGSTSHAPGLVFQTNASKSMAEAARYTAQKFSRLTYRGQPGYLPVGGLEVSTSPERDAELMRRHGWLTSWGIESHLVDTAECLNLHPLLNSSIVSGGLHVPTDGLAKAVNAVGAQVDAAAARGARVRDLTEVLGIETSNGRVTGVTVRPTEQRGADPETIPADIVVCCAGIWGSRITAMVGLDLPLTPMAHQLAWTTDLPSLAGRTTEAIRPILRHQDARVYFRERFGALGIGSYDHPPMPIDPRDIADYDPAAAMPSVLDFTPTDFESAWRNSVDLLPELAQAGIDSAMNGLFSFTADGMPLCGPSSEVVGFWVAEAVWVTHSAGVGAAMAEWIQDGYVSSFDVHSWDLNRFEEHQRAPEYQTARNSRAFAEVYDIVHPLDPPADCRPLRTSPFYPRQRELGASFLEASGWERPQWYEANASLLERYRDRVPTPGEWAARHWSPIVGAEALALRDGVALVDMTALKHLEVTGPDAAEFLNTMVTANVDKSVGSVTYCLMLSGDGGIRSDVTVTRLAHDRFQIGANGQMDLVWLRSHLRPEDRAQVRDVTGGSCCLGLWGPKARAVVEGLTNLDLSPDGLKYFRGGSGYLGAVPVTMLRLSYVGELGWEIYTSADQGLKLWDTLWEAGLDYGLIAAGRGAFSSLRLEKGYRSFGADMSFEHTPVQAGVGFAVRKTATGYQGEEALAARAGAPGRVLACLTSTDPTAVVLGKEPVYSDGRPVGYVTSAGYGYTVERAIAYAWVPEDASAVGTALQIGYFGKMLDYEVTAEPLFDPEMTRLRG